MNTTTTAPTTSTAAALETIRRMMRTYTTATGAHYPRELDTLQERTR